MTTRSSAPKSGSSPSPDAKRRAGLRHAFAIDPEGPAKPTEEQARIVDRLCGEIVRRRLTSPALLYLEVSRPLNYVGSQFLHFIRPILAVMLNTHNLEQFASFLEKRGSIDVLVESLERAEDAYHRSKEDGPSAAVSAADAGSQRDRETERGC